MPCPKCQKEFYGEIYTRFINCPECGIELNKSFDKVQILGEPHLEKLEKGKFTMKEAKEGMEILGNIIKKRGLSE